MVDEEVNYGDEDEHVEVAVDVRKGEDDAPRSASDDKPNSASRKTPTGPREKTRGSVPTGPRERSERDPASVRSEQVKESPKPAAEASSESAEDSLPPGWTRTMSRSHGKYFYFHEVTGKTSWKKPVASESTGVTSQNDPLAAQNGTAPQDSVTPALPSASEAAGPGGERQVNDEAAASRKHARDADERDERDSHSTHPSRHNDRKVKRPPPTGPSASSQNVSTAYASRRTRESAPAPIESDGRDRRRSPSPRRDEPKRFRADEGRRSPFRPDRRDIPRDPPRSAPFDQRPGPILTQTSNFVTRDYGRSRENNGPGGPSNATHPPERERARGPHMVQGANSAPLTNHRWASGPPSGVSTPNPEDVRKAAPPQPLNGRPSVPPPSAPLASPADDTAAKRAILAEKRRKAEEEIKRLAEEEERLEREEAESRKRKEEEDKRRNEREALDEKEKQRRQQQVEDDRAWRARRDEERRRMDEERRRMDEERARGGRPNSPPPPPRPRSPFRGGAPPRSPPRARPLRADGPMDAPRRPGFNPSTGVDTYRPGARLPSPARGPPYPPPPVTRIVRGPDHYGPGDRGPVPFRRSPPPPFDRRRLASPPPPFRRDPEPYRDSYGPRVPPPRSFAEPMSDLAKRLAPRPRSPEPIRHSNGPPPRSLAERMSRPVPDERFGDRREAQPRR